MRSGVKSSLAILAVYVAILVVAGVWLERELGNLSRTMVDGTARLVGQEIGKVISASTLDALLAGDPAASARLEHTVADLSRDSEIVASTTVVDATGKVVVSDSVEAGRQLAPPELIFSDPTHTHFLRSAGWFEGGTSHLFIPLVQDEKLTGYLRLSLRSQPITRLYASAWRQFAFAGIAGLVCIGAVGFLSQIQVERLRRSLTRSLAGALRGEATVSAPEPPEFTQALEIAHEVGRELNAARAQSSQARRQLGTAMEIMDVGVVLLSPKGAVDFASDRARALLAPDSPAALEERWSELALSAGERLGKPRRTGVERTVDIDIANNGHTSPLRLEFHQIDEGQCEGSLILVKSRETIDALESELRLAVQMRAFARFYMAFAHDMRAPLNAMTMNIALLKESLRELTDLSEELQQRQSRYLEVLKGEITRLDRYLSTLLNQATVRDDPRGAFELGELITELASLLTPQAKHRHVTFETQIPESPVGFTGHRDRLKQAMLNIAINALEAMPKGGRLAVTLSENEEKVEIAIADDGPGIPAHVLDKIYGMHFTTKDGGTGIGLYVARSVVESHGGEISVQSEVGQGTCFRVEFPKQRA